MMEEALEEWTGKLALFPGPLLQDRILSGPALEGASS